MGMNLPSAELINSLQSTLERQDLMSPQNNPIANTTVLLNRVYAELISKFASFLDVESFQNTLDDLLLNFLESCRSSVSSGGRLNFSFATTATLGAVPPCSSAVYAFVHGHIKSCNTLLMEERYSWGKDVSKIREGSTYDAGNSINWFIQVITVGAILYAKYKDTQNKLPLKEYLQNTAQIVDEVLQAHDEHQRTDIVLKLRHYFHNNKDNAALAIFKTVDSKNSMNQLPAFAEICRIIDTMGLGANALLERKKRLEKIRTGDIKLTERAEIKRFLKTRFHLSVLMLDRILFEQCIGDCSAVRIEAFTETVFELAHQNPKSLNALSYLQRSLSKDQAMDVIYYWLQNNNPNYPGYIGEMKTHSPKAQVLIYSLINEILITQSSCSEQLGLLGSVTAHINSSAFGKVKRGIFLTNIIQCIYKHSLVHGIVETCPFTKKINMSAAEINELEHYPGLKKSFASYLGNLHATIVNSVAAIAASDEKLMKQVCTDFWRAYILSLWIEMNHISDGKTNSLFQILDYWLEYVIKNQKNSKLLVVLEKVLTDTNYFSNEKLRCFLKYRFGESRKIVSRIVVEEALRKDKAKPEFEAEQFTVHKEEALSLALGAALESRSKSIYAQLDFLNQWNAWAQKNTGAALYEDFGAFEQILKILLKQAPFVIFIQNESKPIRVTVKELLSSGAESTIELEGWGTPVARNMLLLFLFLSQHTSKTETAGNLLYYISSVFIALNIEFDSSKEKSANISALLDELAKHRFFIREVDDALRHIFFGSILPQMAIPNLDLRSRYSSSGVKNVPIALIEEPKPERVPQNVSEINFDDFEEKDLKTPKKKKKRTKAKSPESQSTDVISPEQALAPTPEPVISVEKTVINHPVLEPEPEPEPESEQGLSSDDNEMPALQHSSSSEPDILEELCLTRQIRQQISSLLKQFINWNDNKLSALNDNDPLIAPYKMLSEDLERYQSITHSIRNKIKGKQAKKFKSTILEEVVISEANLFERFQHYHSLVQQLKGLNTDVELIRLTEQLSQFGYLDLLQPALHQRLKLPAEMPIVTQLAALFAPHAQLLVYGSALYLQNPLDIDIKLQWNNSASSIEEIKLCFIQIMGSAGFQVSPVADLFGAASFKLNAKGDAYSLHDHKEIGITLLVTDPQLRPEQLHHNSHSSAALDVLTQKIYCDKEAAEAILRGVFTLGSHKPKDPKEAYRMNVHVLTSLIRACSEQLILDDKSETLLEHIAKIAKYRGHWRALGGEDRLREESLRGMIKRHVTHYQIGDTYKKRTEILIHFLKKMGFQSANESLSNWFKSHLDTLQDEAQFAAVLDLSKQLGCSFRTQSSLKFFYKPVYPEMTIGFTPSAMHRHHE